MNALEYTNENDNVIIWWCGNGSPGGRKEFWHPPETQLPFDLEELEGKVDDNGEFHVYNLTHGDGPYDWSFTDERGNIITNIQLYSDPDEWKKMFVDWLTYNGEDIEYIKEYCESYDIYLDNWWSERLANEI